MRATSASKLAFALVVLTGMFVPWRAEAQGNDPVKPYILFVLDVSGSMDSDTGEGNPSCVSGDTRLNHAKCALTNIVSGYGDMVMGLGRFRQFTEDDNPLDGCNLTQGVPCSDCQANANQCTGEMSSGDRFEVLVPLVEENQTDLLDWVDFSTDTCYVDNTSNPELVAEGATPIVGSLKGAKRYLQGLQTPGIDTDVGVVDYWTGAGGDPIRDDPLKNSFIDINPDPMVEELRQCRPYVVIMMTDGAETCVNPADIEKDLGDATSSLLTTDVDGNTYRVEVKPIGLGRTPGDAQIELMAHNGGTPDDGDPSTYEGFYAQNEEELSLAISEIVSNATKFETCNGLDDDCDALVDEAFPLKDTECDDGALGICKATGTYLCSADGLGVVCNITTPGQPSTTETCNSLDDDCDGVIDEDAQGNPGGLCEGCSDFEVCDGVDNDCDTRVDEDLTRTCGTDVGVCVSGEETCVDGAWQGCDAIEGSPEACDAVDNDCDGVADGFAEECTTLPGNNPGVGVCQSGTRVCPSDGSGSYGACIGEIGPSPELCNLIDDDCDGTVDEETGGASCEGSCGLGTTECVDGVVVCTGSYMPMDEVCNGNDDDCDGLIDEDVPDNGACDDNGRLCVPGLEVCKQGTFQCVGGLEPQDDACDCEDNDCDTQIDEQGDDLCAAELPGSACQNCQCALPCAEGEFPCPQGQYCNENNYCVNDPCNNVECEPDANGNKTECVDGECVPSCDLVTCPSGFVCLPPTGECAPDTCETFPSRCSDTEVCHSGECVPNPCAGVDCPDGQYCAAGQCYDSCGDVTCEPGQRCVLGECEADPCDGDCGDNRFCEDDTGQCLLTLCSNPVCAAGEDCDPSTGQCRQDPCLGVVCPNEGEICREGSCYPSEDTGDDGTEYVAAVGGGCCSAAGSGGPDSGTLLLMFLVLLGLSRRWSRQSEANHA